ncbi:MAG: sigma-70 family RNA polymerase sigma factor [Burkholderiales bacterium]|nr:sigma-70 family RNA polymerase sigma factor [Nitrosomonas sp.]MCP5275989.1 sigma-70 family RNA polymerase sigma factor [Burkholderiales bacterium]
MLVDSDTQLIERIAKQDHDALAQLYQRHVMQMLAVAFRILGSRKDAEDLIHDVFLEIWNKAGDFDAKRSSVRNWILLRVRSRAIDRLRASRQAQKYFSMDEFDESELTRPGPEPEQLAEWQQARSVVKRLPESQYNVVILSYYEGLTCAEIAERCQIPVGTVKSRLSAAIKYLRRVLQPDGEKSHARSK